MHKSIYSYAAMALLSAMGAPVMASARGGQIAELFVDDVRVRRALPAAPGRKRRSKGPQATPKRKPNRLTVGKRVRRKHRRAA